MRKYKSKFSDNIKKYKVTPRKVYFNILYGINKENLLQTISMNKEKRNKFIRNYYSLHRSLIVHNKIH